MRRLDFGRVACLGILIAGGSAHAAEALRVRSGNIERTYFLHVPAAGAASAAMPVLVLLHGSGQTGLPMLREWRELADREGLVLVAPNSLTRDAWRIRDDSPAFFRDVLDAVSARHAIDRRRVYLFGHSGGAVYVLTLALVESEYFAAAALHAGAWRTPAEHAALRYARRRIPVAMFVGDIDQFFPLRDVRQTERALRDAGHPVTVTVIERHGHRYERASKEVNAAAWQFLRTVALPDAPRYRVVGAGVAGTTSNAIVVRGTGP